MKKTSKSITLILALALLAGGVFAWSSGEQHKSNEFKGYDNYNHDIVLVEEFEEPENWQQGDEVDKKVRVHNVGLASRGFQDVYARIQLKEYMEIGKTTYTQTAKRYMTDAAGLFVSSENREAPVIKDW